MSTMISARDTVAVLKLCLRNERRPEYRTRIVNALQAILGGEDGHPYVTERDRLLQAIVGATRGLSDEEWSLVVEARSSGVKSSGSPGA